MHKAFRRMILFTALLVALSGSSYAQESKNINVKFAKGKTSRTYSDAVARSVNTYYLRAKRGQTLIVKISSDGDVARFHIGKVRPGNRNENAIKFIDDGDLTTYTDKIDTDDEIAIPVGAIRGGTSYKLTITIK